MKSNFFKLKMTSIMMCVSLMLLPGCFDAKQPDYTHKHTIKKESAFASNGTLNIQNSVGNIKIVNWDQDAVAIVAKKWAPSQKELDAIKVSIVTDKKTATITTEHPANTNGRVDYTVHVPQKIKLIKVVHGAGDVAIKHVEGDIDVNVGKGAVKIDAVTKKDISIQTRVGAGSITMHNANGPVDANVGKGDITLSIPTNTNASIYAKTGVGTIYSDFPGTFDKRTPGPGTSFSTKIDEGTASIKLNSGVGTIRITNKNNLPS